MKRHPIFQGNLPLCIGLTVNFLALSARYLLDLQGGPARLCCLAQGAAVGLMGLGLFQLTPLGAAALARLRAFKTRLAGGAGR